MNIESLSFETANGETGAYVAMPELPSDKAVIVIHEWWGLNEHIKDIARRYAGEGFVAVAPDLYRGTIATDGDDASKLMHDLKIEDGLDTIKSTIDAASGVYYLASFGITGFCMGGTFALRAACEIDSLKAAVAFYGDIPEDDVVKLLSVPTTFISGTRDAWITPEKVSALENAAARYGLPVNVVKYDADHAFFNDTRPEVYDKANAEAAWKLAIGVFNASL